MLLFWILFNLGVLVALAIDLGLFHRKAHKVSFREAVIGSAAWVLLALGFAGFVYQWHGHQATLEFVTGYLVELSLSVDNLFVFLVLFNYFRVPSSHQYKVLYWGIVGALVMRGIFIFAGVTLLNRFHWLIYLFGAFLVYTGIRLAFGEEKDVDPEQKWVVRTARKFLPFTTNFHGDKFFVRESGRRLATPLLLVLIAVETTDLLFAADSIPAILAITRDTFIVYTSNVFAILGLRSMYFALAGMIEVFHYLKYGLAFILSFIGVKMLLSSESAHIGGLPLHYEIPIGVALGVVAGVLAISVAASLMNPKTNRG
jgi:tellurite resistance protein TerC